MTDDDVSLIDKKWLALVASGMVLRIVIGSVLGLTVFNNLALGAGIGLVLGIVIGSGLHLIKKH